MPDPRSLRFGFGLGICLLVAAFTWLIWPAAPAELDRTSEHTQEAGRTAVAASVEDLSAEEERSEAEPAPPPTLPLKYGHESPPRGKVQIIERSTGAPLPNFDVYATLKHRRAERLRTNQEGWLELTDSATAGAWSLRPSKEAGGPWAIHPALIWADPELETQVYLERSESELHLSVHGPTGLPVAGATINIVRVATGRAQTFLSYESDADGSLRLPWPPAGSETENWIATASHATEGACLPTPIHAPSVQASTQLQLQRGARLDLRVSDPARNPYGYLEVRLRSLSLSRNAFVQQLKNSPTYLDFDGVHFWTQLAPGNYKLSIRSPVGVGWLDREFTMTGQAQRIDWVIETPPQAIALAGRLEDDWGNYSPPVVNHYVQLTDASTGELIAGTRTDMDGRFKLFGEVIGEVVLHTDLLESEFSFPPHEHRFPAGKQDVVLRAGDNPRPELDFRVLDQTTKLAIPRARLVRAESEFDVLAGISTAAGVLRAAIHPHWAYLLQADGYEPARLSGDPKEWPSTHYLEAAN